MSTARHGTYSLPQNPDFFNVAERRTISDGISELLTEVSAAQTLDLALQSIRQLIEAKGMRGYNKLNFLSPIRPSAGLSLEAHLLTPQVNGIPYIAADLKIFKPSEQELISVLYRYQNSNHDPSMTEVEIVGPIDTTMVKTPYNITTRLRTYNPIEKWGRPEEDVTSTTNPNSVLDALQVVSRDYLALLG